LKTKGTIRPIDFFTKQPQTHTRNVKLYVIHPRWIFTEHQSVPGIHQGSASGQGWHLSAVKAERYLITEANWAASKVESNCSDLLNRRAFFAIVFRFRRTIPLRDCFQKFLFPFPASIPEQNKTRIMVLPQTGRFPNHFQNAEMGVDK
jgi:hypothetical protein